MQDRETAHNLNHSSPDHLLFEINLFALRLHYFLVDVLVISELHYDA